MPRLRITTTHVRPDGTEYRVVRIDWWFVGALTAALAAIAGFVVAVARASHG